VRFLLGISHVYDFLELTPVEQMSHTGPQGHRATGR
jgi:hypothetical protein